MKIKDVPFATLEEVAAACRRAGVRRVRAADCEVEVVGGRPVVTARSLGGRRRGPRPDAVRPGDPLPAPGRLDGPLPGEKP